MKKVLIIFLVLSMILVVVSCSRDNGNDNQKPEAAEGPLGKYEPTLNLVTALSTLDATVKSTDDSNPDNNVWTRAYRDELGIEVTNMWSTNASQGDDRINLAITAGDIPDVFRVNQIQFEQLVSAGKLADISSAYDNYAGEFMLDVMSRPGSDTAMQACSRDGKLYGIPYFLNMTDDTRVVYIRADWLRNLGIDEPNNFQDIVNIAKAFKDDDPDGDGADNTFGMPIESTIFASGSGIFRTFMNSFHAYPFGWIEENGKLVNGLTQADPMKKGLAMMADLYNDGYIVQDFASYSWDDQFIPALMNGQVGLVLGGLWEGWWPIGETKQTDPEADWKMYPLFSIDEEPAKAQSKEIILMGITVVREGFSNPESLIKMVNLCNKKMWESDPETFNAFGYDSAGNNPWLYSAAYFEFPGKNYTLYQKTSRALETGVTDDLNGEETLIYNWMKEYVDGVDLSRWGIYLSYGPDSSCAQIDYYLENNLYEYDKFYGIPPKSQLDNEALLNDLFAEYAYKIVTGEYEIDRYDQFIDEWYSQGGQEWTNDINTWYEEINN